MLRDLLSPQRVFTDLKPQPKDDLLREMVGRLAAQKAVGDADAIAHLLIQRERLITTGVKEGFAFPHAFSPEADSLFLAVGVVREGTDYAALDGKPVEFIFLLIGPPRRQDVHLRVLARLSRIAGEDEMLEALRKLKTPRKIVNLLVEMDRKVGVV